MKKQIAVLMAAATAVTTVAPVVANAANVQTDKATALAKVKEAFAVRYTDPAETGLVGKVVKDGKEYMNSVYKYAAKIDGTYRKADGTREFADVKADSYEGLSLEDIEALFNYANLHGKEVVLEKYNKGFRKFDNFISPSEYTAYQKYVVDAADANNDQTIKDMFTNMLYIKKGTDFVAPDYLASVEYNGLRYVLKSVGASKTPALVPEALAADANLSLMSMADLVGKKVVFLNKADAAAAKVEALTTASFEVFDFANVLRINLAGGATITLNEKSSYVLNFEYAIDKDGKIHNVKAKNIKDVADAATKIIDFGKVETVNGTKQAYNIATKLDSEENVFVSQASYKYDIKDLYSTADGYTVKGADVVNRFIKAAGKAMKDSAGKFVNQPDAQFNFDGKRYQIYFSKATLNSIEQYKDNKGNWGFDIPVKVVALDDVEGSMGRDVAAFEKKVTSAVVRFEGASELEVSTVLRDLINGKEVVAARRNVLAGQNRFDTAIAISKERFEKADSANAVVLVGQYSIVDGLAAAPFAKAANAPVLFSRFDSIDKNTVEEIGRLLGKDSAKKVYIVGGENTISAKVHDQLVKELNYRVERIEGRDRYETSRKLADKLSATTNRTSSSVEIVGGRAEADAMSISAVAARDLAPIIVVPQKQLDYATKEYLNKNYKTGVDYNIIGGVNSVSAQVEKDLVAITDHEKGVKRFAGDNRQLTNAEVISAFYNKAEGLVVAKSDTKSLVDALAAAPLAGEKKYPILLATKKLEDAQKTALRNHVVGYHQQKVDNGYAKVYEVGMGIASEVMTTVYQILGL
nr:cell wall-binding repeat-containing protein [uncultured Peptostreptococcus sp.]